MRNTLKCFLIAAAVLLATTGTAHAGPYTLSQTFDDPTDPRGDLFGFAVAMDGGNIVIGAPFDFTHGLNVGQAHLFDAATGNLLQTLDDPTPTYSDTFGWSVAIDGDYVVIGAPGDITFDSGQAHLFDAATGHLLQTFNDPTVTGSDQFGTSVAIYGGYVLIGAPFDDTNGHLVGQAHLFDAATGNLLHTFDNPSVTGADEFGISVAIDGGYVLIGAPYDQTNGTLVGQAHLFDVATGNLLRTFNDPSVTGADGFGASVAIDGGNVLIGAPADNIFGTAFYGGVNEAYLFDAATGNLLQTFNNPTRGHDLFGGSVAIDGDNVLIGAPFDSTYRSRIGQAHLFDAATGSLLQTFNDPTATDRDYFGLSVAIDGDNILVGAPLHETNNFHVGQAHLFVPEPSGFVLMALGIGVAALFGYGRRRRADAGR